MDFSLSSSLVGSAVLNANKLSLDLQFAADKTLTARKGPTPVFTRASTATFVGSNGLIQSASVNAARFDHDPIILACKGLLIEESRTNSITGSNAFNTWTMSSSTVAASSVSTPEGTADAWKVVEDILLAGHTATRSFSAVSGTTYTASVWIKSAENGFAFVGMTSAAGAFSGAAFISVNLSTGAVTTATGSPVGATSVSYSNGWFRVSFSLTAIATFSSLIDIRLSRDGIWANRSYLGNGVNGMYCYGAQVEAGSFATSYIPTATSSVVRSADVCSITGSAFSGFYNNFAGTIVAVSSAVGFATSNNSIVAIDSGTTAVLRLFNRTAQGNRLSSQVSSVLLTPAANYNTANVVYKSAISADAAGADFVIDGTQIPDSYTGASLSADNLKFTGASGSTSNNTITSFRYYKKRLPVAKLQALTV